MDGWMGGWMDGWIDWSCPYYTDKQTYIIIYIYIYIYVRIDMCTSISYDVHVEAGISRNFKTCWSRLIHAALNGPLQVNVRNMAGLEAISFSRTPQMQSIVMKHDVNFWSTEQKPRGQIWSCLKEEKAKFDVRGIRAAIPESCLSVISVISLPWNPWSMVASAFVHHQRLQLLDCFCDSFIVL